MYEARGREADRKHALYKKFPICCLLVAKLELFMTEATLKVTWLSPLLKVLIDEHTLFRKYFLMIKAFNHFFKSFNLVTYYLSSLMFTTTFRGVFCSDPGLPCSGSLRKNFLEAL